MSSAVHTVSKHAVLRALPTGMERRFDPTAAGDLDATLELRITDNDTRYAVRVADRRCTVTRGAAPDAGAFVAVSAGDVVRLVTGAIEWPVLLAAKRLELGGDPFLALRFPKLFGFGVSA